MTKSRPHNDVFLRALAQEAVPYTPIWLMRQAGRYLPEYRVLRQQAGSFMNLCRNPELAAEVTLQPLARFPLDAAIVFSDILTIPDAMGLELSFVAGEGPMFGKPLRDEAAIRALPVPDPSCELRYVLDAVRHSRRALANRVPLIGFAGSPYTLACYMIEGKSSRDFTAAKALLYKRPDLMHHLLEVLSQSIILYLNAQIEAGAQVVMLFDSWGGNLSGSTYREFSLAYMQRIIAGLKKVHEGQTIPNIIFTRGGGLWLEAMAESGCSALGLDWQVDLADARRRVGTKVALQGNLDPSVLLGTPLHIVSETQRILQGHATIPGYIFNLGHGVLQQTPVEHIALLVETVQGFAKKSS